MQRLKTYFPSVFVALAVLSYTIFPSAYQEPGSALLSCLAVVCIIMAVFANGRLPHPAVFTASQWLVVAFIVVQIIALILAPNIRHSLWGFSFDTTSAMLLILVSLLTLISDALLQKTRRALFVVSLIGLLLLAVYPLVRSQVHVRLSAEANMLIESSMYAEEGTKVLLFGTGQNTFVYAWQKYRPQAVLSTPFWNEDFPLGNSIVLTVLVETGIVSAFLLVLMFVVAFAEECFREVVRGHGRILRIRAFFCAAALIAAVCALVFGEPSAPLILVSGILLASFRQTEKIVFVLSPIVKRTLQVVGFALLFSVLYIGLATFLYFYSYSKVVAGDLVEARAAAERSYFLTKDPQTARLLTQILRSTGHEFGRMNSPKTLVQSTFKEASAYAREATRSEPQNEQNWKLLGIALAEELALEKKKEYFEEAKKAFEQAQRLSPLDASTLFFKGQLYILAGDHVEAKIALDAALLLRPSYVEAKELRDAMK